MYASVYVACQPSWFTYIANEMDLHRGRCVAPLRALPLHPCHGDELSWNIIDVAMCVLHSAPSAARRRCRYRCPFTMGRQSSLSVDRVLRFYLPLHLHLYSLTVQERIHYVPKPHVPNCECREGYIMNTL